MADIPPLDILGTTGVRTVFILIVAGILMTAFSVSLLTVISHNLYASTYYTLSVLFGASGAGADGADMVISQTVPLFSANFYILTLVSLADGAAKVVIIGFIVATFISVLSGVDIRSRIHVIFAKGLKNHTIVCGYSQLGEKICRELSKKNERFLVIDRNPETAGVLGDLGYTVISGDFTRKETLEEASIRNAKAIIFATEDDFLNLLGVVTAKHITPNIRIISRAREERDITKMQRAGAEFCLVPEIVAGIELGESVLAKA